MKYENDTDADADVGCEDEHGLTKAMMRVWY